MTISVTGPDATTWMGADTPGVVSRWQDYLERRVATAERTRDAHNRVMSEVAAGTVDQRALDRRLNSFVQLNGPEHAAAMAELSMRFLAGLVAAGATYSRELRDLVVPGADHVGPTGEVSPPEFDPDDPWGNLQRLVEFAEDRRTEQVDALRAVMGRVASGEVTPQEVEERMAGRSAEQVPESVGRILELYLDLMTGIDELNASFGADYLSSVLPDDRARRAVTLRGRPGETVSVALGVTNDEPVTATMRCTMSDVRRADGIGPAFDPGATVTPSSFELDPGGEQRIELAVTLGEAYHPDADHVGELRVVGSSDTVVEVPLRLLATTSGSAA